MERYGHRVRRCRVGLRIAMAIGFGQGTTAGVGWIMRRGAGLRITMAGGFGTGATDGPGGRVRGTDAITGARRWWASLARVGLTLGSASARSAGWRWLRMKCAIRGGDADTTAAGIGAGEAMR